MAKRKALRVFSTPSLHNLSLRKLIEELDHYSPEMLSLLPPVQRKELLLLCPVVSICHLEQTCAFKGIDSNMFWDDLLKQHDSRLTMRCCRNYDIHAHEVLSVDNSSSRDKYFTFLTTMIFSGDRFSGIYGWFINNDDFNMRDYYEEGQSPPPEQQSCPDDIVNYLIAYRKPAKETVNLEYDHDDNDFYYPLPSRDVYGRQHGKLYEGATRGQHVHSRYSRYISKENHYRLSDDDAVSLMMNECHYYPKKLFLHEYEHMHWKWSRGDLMRLLTQFFSKLESLSLEFRQSKDIDDYLYKGDSKEALELVLSCCFSSPVLSSLHIVDPVIGHIASSTASNVLSSTLAAKPCPSLKKFDIHCWVRYSGKIHCLEAVAKIIASHSQLTEICVSIDTSAEVDPIPFSCLYTSLTGFIQRQEFSKLTLHGLVPISQLQPLLDTFLKTPCSQPQEFHLQSIQPVRNEATPVHVLVGENKVPSGALEYKSLFLDEHSNITVGFCEWLFSHEPLALKTFNFDAGIVNFREYGRFETFKTAEHNVILSENALFQTRELTLPIFDLPNEALTKLLHCQQLTHLSLRPVKRHEPNSFRLGTLLGEVPKPCNINAITEILSCQKEQLVELTISRQYYNYVSIEPSADMERFGEALFSLRNLETFSLCIAIIWTKDDTNHIDRLYDSWVKHGRKKMKSFQMGKFEYQFSLTDELAAKLDKMGLEISDYYGRNLFQ